MSEESGTVKTPPYLSFTTLKNFLGSFKEGVVPTRIDKTLMPGQSGATQSYLIGALKFFTLIDENGRPQPDLHTLVEGSDEVKKAQWKKLVERAYGPTVDGLDLTRTTAGELQDKFAALGLNGETLRKCQSFFVAAAQESGIPLSPQIKPKSRNGGGGVKRQRKSRPLPKPTEDSGDSHDIGHVSGGGKGTVATLLLDVDGSRKITLHGPPDITTGELERLKSWVSFQFIVKDK